MKEVARGDESKRLRSWEGSYESGTGFAESFAAKLKHAVMSSENTRGITKKYRQLKTVASANERANAHLITLMRAKVSVAMPPSCHAKTAASNINTVTNNPNPTKKSQ